MTDHGGTPIGGGRDDEGPGRGSTATRPAERRGGSLPLDAVIDRHDAKAAKATTGRMARRGARAMGVANLASQVTRIMATIALARLLTPEIFGIVALVTVVTGFFERVLGDTGTSAAIVREKELTQKLASSVFWFNVSLGTTTTTLFVVLGPLIARALGEADATPYVRALGFTALINSFSYVQQSMLRRQGRFRPLAVSVYTNVAATSAISIALAAAGWEVWALIVGTLAGSVLGVAMIWQASGWRPGLHFKRADLMLISNFSANISAYNFFGYFVNSGDRLIVGRLIGAEALGYYGMSNRLMRYPVQSGIRPFKEVVLPMLSKLQDDHPALGRVYIRSLSALFFVVMPTTVSISVLADPLVRGLLGDQWIPAIPIVSIIAIVATLQALTVTTGSLFAVAGRTDLWLRWGVFSAAVTMACYFAGSFWGVEGVAWGYLAAIAGLTYPSFKIPFRLVGLQVRDLARAIAPTVGATLVMAAAIEAVRRWADSTGVDPLMQLAIGLGTGAVVYGGWALVARPRAFLDVLSLARREQGSLSG
ncbi:MAG: lipopolysaccharide biosynthesis protein [Actinomycetota bacterium]